MQWLPKTFSITVSGGSGSQIINITGPMGSISLVPPDLNDPYDVTITDNDGFILLSEQNVLGKSKIVINEGCVGNHTISLSNAPDGEFKFKIRWQDW